jgi:hypothetical protein
MPRCSLCEDLAEHSIPIDDGHMGYYCDRCILAGKLAFIGISEPAEPGLTPAPLTLRVPFEMPSHG